VAVKAAPSRTSNPPEQAKRSHTIELESGLLHQRPARGVARFREGRWYHSLVAEIILEQIPLTLCLRALTPGCERQGGDWAGDRLN